MKLLTTLAVGWLLSISGITPSHAYSAISVHEIEQESAPQATLELQKDPTGGFNVHVVTTNFTWRPDMESMQHVPGEGHAHVYLDGRKIMRIYNEWFHLNTFQFATRPGEQLLSIEFVGNDHAPYTIQGAPVGVMEIVDVARDEIQPGSSNTMLILAGGSLLLVIAVGGLLIRFKARQK